MQLTQWNPFREMEEMFGRCVKASSRPCRYSREIMTTGDWAPRVDIAETDKEYIIKVKIPGVNKEDVKVTVENGVLTIRGERKQEKEEKSTRFHRIERFYGSFTRSFPLPENVDETKINASFKDGMLNLQIPKTAESKPKVIDVTVK